MLYVLQGSPLRCARMCRYGVYGASLESGVGCCRWCDGNPVVQLKVGLEPSEGEGEAATPPSQSQVEVAL